MKAGKIESTVQRIEATEELILVSLFEDEVDELWEEIWRLPKWQRKEESFYATILIKAQVIKILGFLLFT